MPLSSWSDDHPRVDRGGADASDRWKAALFVPPDGVLFIIFVTVVLAGIWTNYGTSIASLEVNADRLRALTGAQIDTSFRMIDAGLKFYDGTYNDRMEDAFVLVMEEYNPTACDPSRMDIDGLKERTGMDVYVIDERDVVVYSSKPADLGLDFRAIYPDFSAYLDSIRNTSGFYPDRITEDWTTRRMTKWGYMPTPDHRYTLELGLSTEPFADEPMRLRYTDVVDKARRLNPYLESALLFQKQKRLVNDTAYVPTLEESAMLDYLLWQNRTTQVVPDPVAGRTTVWQVVDLRDPDYSADVSVFAKLVYDDALLAAETGRIATLHALAALLVVVTGAFLAVTVSRRVARPIAQLVEDVDTVAAGDLDHAIRPVAWHEFSALAEKTGVMVGRLQEQIRQRDASEQRFADTLRLLPQAAFETDLDGTVTFANRAALEAIGVGADELERGFSVFSAIAPKDHDRARTAFAAVLAGPVTSESEYTGLRRDGTTFPMLTRSAARLDDGAVVGIRGSFVDIGRLKQVEAE